MVIASDESRAAAMVARSAVCWVDLTAGKLGFYLAEWMVDASVVRRASTRVKPTVDLSADSTVGWWDALKGSVKEARKVS